MFVPDNRIDGCPTCNQVSRRVVVDHVAYSLCDEHQIYWATAFPSLHKPNCDRKVLRGYKQAYPYFGGCPTCKTSDGHLNIELRGAIPGFEHLGELAELAHFGVCRAHSVYWHIGSNLFSPGDHDHEATWAKNRQLLREYTKVTPV